MAKDKDREFYKNLDEYKRSKSGCSCLGLFLLAVGVLIVAEIFLFYAARSIKYDASQDATFATVGSGDLKFSNLGEGGDVEIVVSEGILCSKISAIYSQKKLACIIDEGGITLTGKIATFLPSNAAIVVFPEVKSGRISYRVDSLKIGRFGTPQFLAPTASSVLEKTIGSELEGVEVEGVGLDRGIMVIIGKRK